MKVGLFFGSFNPVHTGHLIMANYIVEHSDLEELWLVVTPHNPHKNRATLADDYDRLNLVELAIKGHQKLRACSIEFELPKPSFTIDTLTYLKERNPDDDFTLIMGGDNLKTLHKWKNYEQILKQYSVLVYTRPGYTLGPLVDNEAVEVLQAPMMEISSTQIRKLIAEEKSIRYWVPREVEQEILRSGLYQNI
jgi:nicotinate-nucleotide adenylyltransferase